MLLAMALASAAPTQLARTGIEVPNAIVQQHNAYVRCQDDHFDIGKVRDTHTFVEEVEKAIAECRDQKAALIEESERILSTTPDYLDPSKRQNAISQAFDGYDALRREMARGGSSL